jgi:hypothetical protein
MRAQGNEDAVVLDRQGLGGVGEGAGNHAEGFAKRTFQTRGLSGCCSSKRLRRFSAQSRVIYAYRNLWQRRQRASRESQAASRPCPCA